jgi:hypothetical protein
MAAASQSDDRARWPRRVRRRFAGPASAKAQDVAKELFEFWRLSGGVWVKIWIPDGHPCDAVLPIQWLVDYLHSRQPSQDAADKGRAAAV